jgi:DNA-directed RNA polymerase subunit RPC12/RpoP
MVLPYWLCLECSKEFKPITGEGNFSFNCPACGSHKTIANRKQEKRMEADLNIIQNIVEECDSDSLG